MRIKNCKHGGDMQVDGYEDMGFINGGCVQKNIKYINCITKDHIIRTYDNSIFLWRATDEVTICDECKIYYHTDMSD
jgi:hypothetical protein